MTYGYDNGSGGAAGKKKLAAIGISSLILVAVVLQWLLGSIVSATKLIHL